MAKKNAALSQEIYPMLRKFEAYAIEHALSREMARIREAREAFKASGDITRQSELTVALSDLGEAYKAVTSEMTRKGWELSRF